jgi:tetratricopeptide (TPR) repeat protein
MSRNSILPAAIAALALAGVATPALADFSACESALQTNDLHQKIALYTTCIKHGGVPLTDVSSAFNNRGVAYRQIGEIDKAFDDFSSAIDYDPNWGAAYVNRGRIYFNRREWAKADADFTEATRKDPAEARVDAFASRALLRVILGQYKGALADYEAALSSNRKLVEAYVGEAWLLATCQDDSIRDGKKAVMLAQQGLKLEDRPALHDALAAAYAESGQFEDAVREQEKVVELARAGRPGNWPVPEERLALYKGGVPFRIAPLAQESPAAQN